MVVYRPRTPASALKAQLKAATRSQRSYQPPAGGGMVITSATPLGGVLTGTLPNALLAGGLTIDANDGAFYGATVSAAANAWGSAAFTSRLAFNGSAIPVGAIMGQPASTPAFWSYEKTGTSGWTIYVANNGGAAATYQWYGVILGALA